VIANSQYLLGFIPVEHLEVVLPSALVILAFACKLFIDQHPTLPILIKSLYELPISIVFLAVSFVTGYVITFPAKVGLGLSYLFTFLICMVLSIVLWRRSTLYFERNFRFWSAVIFIINATIASYLLYFAVVLIISNGGAS